MGLDMYLSARMYLSEYSEDGSRIQKVIRDNVPEINDMTPNYINAEAMYWRKANAIHQWFVNNVQDGEDNCGRYYVDRSSLQELLDIVNQVIADPEQASILLPTTNGFFFGGTEYDEWYFDNLNYTRDRLTELLDSKYDNWEFEYHSSW